MRVLLVPELYRPDDPSANGTLADAVTWVEGWLDRDPALHVYWLVAPQVPDESILADRERVTAIRAEPFGPSGDADRADESDLFTEGGYSWAELEAIRREIFDRDAYLDCVVDQRRTGRFDLSKWLHHHTDQWAADVSPFDIVVNVHDLQVPFKYRYCSYRDAFQGRMEMAGAVFADSIWFKAGVDAERLREYATDVLRPGVVEDALDDALETGSPIDFSAFEERYADEPRYLHLAGSLWEKKHADRLLAVGEHLHEEFGVETLLTSMESIPGAYAEPDWLHAYPEADRETYETALRRGDLAVCASEYETMARTPFEQAASGQVLVLRDEPWIYDCVPEDYRLAGDTDDLADLAAEAVRHWDEAISENRRLVARVREVRDPEASARRTYRDLRERVESKRERYDLDASDNPVRAALADGESACADAHAHSEFRELTRSQVKGTRSRAAARASGRESASGTGAPDRESAPSASASDSESTASASGAASENAAPDARVVGLDDLRARTAEYTDDGGPVTESSAYALADLVYALRSLGYRDAGNPGTPVFVRA